jgi:hypothetical protein
LNVLKEYVRASVFSSLRHRRQKDGGDSHCICWVHYYKWHEARARFLADGGGCAMQELGQLLCDECWNEANSDVPG